MFISVQFSLSVVSDSSRPHESQHARPPCPSPTPGVDSNSCPSSRWCHTAISSSVVPFSSCPQSLPATGSFPRCYLSLKGKKREGFSEPSMRSWGKTTTTHQKRGQHNKCPCPLLQPPPLPCWSLPNAFRSQRNRKPFDADPVGQPLRHRGRRWRQVEMKSRKWFQRDRCKQPVGNYHLEYAYCLEKHHRRNWPCFWIQNVKFWVIRR